VINNRFGLQDLLLPKFWQGTTSVVPRVTKKNCGLSVKGTGFSPYVDGA